MAEQLPGMPPDDDTRWRSADYVEPADRPAEWAEMAASFARDGWGAAEIADSLCVDEEAVARLLELAQQPAAPQAAEEAGRA